ncbi:MAG: Veg family protein [Clostridia bacterium]|nr:Veg family protein [Clostridia bacterium]
MRKVNSTLEDVIEQITKLKGQDLNFEVTRGRKKTLRFLGVIESIYPSIFIVKNKDDLGANSVSYSYADVLCGDVSISQDKSIAK